MAENDRRSYRDSAGWRSAEEPAPAQADDPLAELARLIGQSVPMERMGRDRRPAAPVHANDRSHETERGAVYPTPNEVVPDAPDEGYFAAEAEPHRRDIDDNYRTAADARYEPIDEADPTPPRRASRFRHEPNFPSAPPREVDDGAGDEAAHGASDWHNRSSDERDSRYADEYEDEGHDAHDHAYDGEYSEDQNTGRRGGFVFVAAVFVLAVLGTAGAFAYRTMFAGPAMPALPPIIKAEGGPNKIVPNDVNSQDSPGRENANGAGSRERLVSREERPVDIPPPVASAAPRPVATVPVFPDPPRMGGPGAVVGYSTSPPSNNAGSAAEPPRVANAPLTTATAPNLAPSVALPAPESSAPPSVSAPTLGGPGPKKIRTVTIRTDQSTGADGPAGTAANQAIRSGSQSQTGNGPLSIVPSSPEAPAPAARPRAAAAQPAPLNKPPAKETASAAPMATASGGYAVQVSSQHSEEEAQSSFRALQAKYPDLLGGREPIIRRADLGAKGIYFRAMAGPFTSADQANELCSNLKAAGGSCIVQKN
jgi:sporulation related protein